MRSKKPPIFSTSPKGSRSGLSSEAFLPEPIGGTSSELSSGVLAGEEPLRHTQSPSLCWAGRYARWCVLGETVSLPGSPKGSRFAGKTEAKWQTNNAPGSAPSSLFRCFGGAHQGMTHMHKSGILPWKNSAEKINRPSTGVPLAHAPRMSKLVEIGHNRQPANEYDPMDRLDVVACSAA